MSNENELTGLTTVNGYYVDEVLSLLRKAIRQGRTEDAALAAYEMESSGDEMAGLLWRCFEVAAVEDVGISSPDLPMIIEALTNQRDRQEPREKWNFTAHAIYLLCTLPKDRRTSELGIWALVTTRGGAQLPIANMHIDSHTQRGRELGRDGVFWWNSGGNSLSNRLAEQDSPWSHVLRELVGAPASGPVPEPDLSPPPVPLVVAPPAD
jgi:replication-associated recombination protein RarA